MGSIAPAELSPDLRGARDCGLSRGTLDQVDRNDVPEVARDQGGVFTRQQAYDEGWTARKVRRRLTSRRWRVIAGIAVGPDHLVVSSWSLAFSAWLTWPGCVVSHEVAGWLHGLPVAPASHATVIVPRNIKVRGPNLIVRRQDLSAPDVGRLGGHPATTQRRTAFDLLAALPWPQTRSLWGWLTARRILDLSDLRSGIDGRRGMAGTPQLRRLLQVSATGAISPAEDVLHNIMQAAGLRGWRANVPVIVDGRVIAIVDVLFEGSRVVIEVDGWATHSSREAFHRDRVRQNDLVLAGYTVLRFTWQQLTHEPAAVVRAIRLAVARVA
jgi:very-short-patch-repair endonuclease